MHTPGPWRVSQQDPNGVAVRTARGTLIAHVASAGDPDVELANGCVMAAAPAMLAALEPFVKHNSSAEFVTITVRTIDVARARAAIAAATGAA